jgi:dTDP-6-deoxy-L-talose 4-dehydrogenase (NAD+)
MFDDANLFFWGRKEQNIFDLLVPESWEALADARPECVVLLAWPGLPHYQEPYHVTRNLPLSLQLVLKLVDSGIRRIVIAGTCYEYGLKNGQLVEHHATQPVNQYAIAKDCLRKSIEALAAQLRFEYQWLRIFYPFGEGQNPNSFLPSLDRAIERGDHAFEMSSGRQIRDFLPVEDVARHLVVLATHLSASGTYNSGSGVPASLREIAERRIKERASSISLRLGVYPDRWDEPLAFWADMSRMHALMQTQPF